MKIFLKACRKTIDKRQTVTVSSFMIDFIHNFGIRREDEDSGKETLADNGQG